ncbi:hypothetical protein Tco_0445869 [Tanacetum coccineum]
MHDSKTFNNVFYALKEDLIYATGNGYSREGTKRKPKANKTEHGVEKTNACALVLKLVVYNNNNKFLRILLNLPSLNICGADKRTAMAELLQAPTEGYEDAIVVPEIEAANFEIKHGLLTLVQNKQFFGHDKEDPHAHIRYFNKITSTLRYPNVPTTNH